MDDMRRAEVEAEPTLGTVEWADLFKPRSDACYALQEPVRNSRRGRGSKRVKVISPKEGADQEVPGQQTNYSQLMDRLQLIDPTFVTVRKLEDVDKSEFEVREWPRPPGYCAMTRLHVGRLCTQTLLDTGASCACVTEEQVCLILNHCDRMLAKG